MHEKYAEDEQPLSERKRDLIGILQSDWTTPEQQSLQKLAEQNPNDVLADLLANSVEYEKTWERYESEESLELGLVVGNLLSAATITDSFKRHIIHEVKWAHATQGKTSEKVSPERLGIVDGDGIYSSETAPLIEEEALTNEIRELYQQFVVVPVEINGQEGKPYFREVTPQEAEGVARTIDWVEDYQINYAIWIFDRLNQEELLAASKRAQINK